MGGRARFRCRTPSTLRLPDRKKDMEEGKKKMRTKSRRCTNHTCDRVFLEINEPVSILSAPCSRRDLNAGPLTTAIHEESCRRIGVYITHTHTHARAAIGEATLSAPAILGDGTRRYRRKPARGGGEAAARQGLPLRSLLETRERGAERKRERGSSQRAPIQAAAAARHQ